MAVNTRKIVATVLVLIGTLATMPTLYGRLQREREARPVDLVMELKSYKQLADQEHVPLPQLLNQMHQAGATSVAVSEMDLNSLRVNGQATVLMGSDLASNLRLTSAPHPLLQGLLTRGDLRPTATYVVTDQRDLFNGLASAASDRLAADQVRTFTAETPTPLFVLEMNGSPTMINQLGFGFNPADMKMVEDAGLRVVPRPRNFPAVTPDKVQRYFEYLHAMAPSAKSIVFEGGEVLGQGQPGALAATVQALGLYDLRLDLIENAEQTGYAPQAGQDVLAQLANWKVTRLFGISPDYQAKLGPNNTADTWMRGVIDRGIRAVYMRPWMKDPLPGKSLVETNLVETRYIAGKLVDDGYSVGLGGFYRPLMVPFYLHVLQALGVVGGALLWLLWTWPVSRRFYWSVAVLGTVAALGTAYYGQRGNLKGFELLALGAACVYPALGITAVIRRWAMDKPLVGVPGTLDAAGREGFPKFARTWLGSQQGLGRMLYEGLWAILVMSVLSALGGFLVGSLMGDIRFMLEFGYFYGVKVAFIVPLLLATISFVTVGRERAGAKAGANVWQDLKRYLSLPITYGSLVFGVLALGALFWYLQRSGNNPLVPVPQWELQMRDWLERTLVARPREKEFLIGYPLLMIGAALWVRGLRNWLLPFVIAAGTAGISVLNSFCHIRTGFYMSGLRWLNGLLLGLPISIVVTVLVVLLLNAVARLGLREGRQPGKGTRA